MALLDLSIVTRMLIRLVREVVSHSPAWDGSTPAVSPLPPDKLAEEGDLLGFYLYHIAEDPHVRNTFAPGTGPSPAALAPMGLVLHYQLTAHTTATHDLPEGAYKAQRLFGLAVKALHDHASIVDSTEVHGVRLLEAYGLHDRQNRLRLTLRPTPVEEAVTYWTAGQGPARLAAYYQVSVVMLEPERPASLAPPVLDRAPIALVGGPPHLSGSRSEIEIAPPAAAARTVTASPAQAPIGGRFSLQGSELAGDATDLLLERPGWDAPQVVDPIAWSLVVSASEVSATLQPRAGDRDVVPGVYAAAVEVRRQAGAGAAAQAIVHRSNRTAIVVTPVFAAPGPAAPGGLVTLTGSLFQHADIPTDPDDERAVQVIVGTAVLALDDDGVVTAGEFEVTDASTITLRLPGDLAPGFLPLRVRVGGAESPPRWLEVA